MAELSGTHAIVSTTGTLERTPLAQALVYIRAKRLTGTLVLEAPDARTAHIAFWRGSIAHAATTPPVARFGCVAYELGSIDAPTLDAATVASVEQHRPEEDLLVESGALTTKQRRVIEAEQASRRVHYAFTFPAKTRFEFAEAGPLAAEPPVAVDPLVPAWRGVVDFPPAPHVQAMIARIGERPLRLLSEAVLERAELGEEERAMCEALVRSPLTLAAMRGMSNLPRARVDLLAWFLVIARCAAAESARASAPPPATTQAPGRTSDEAPRLGSFELPAAPPAAASAVITAFQEPLAPARDTPAPAPDAATLRPPAPTAATTDLLIGPAGLGPEGIRRRAVTIAFESPWAVLGLPEGAAVEARRAARVRLSRLWHPDRLPEDLEEVRPEATCVYIHVLDAYRTVMESSGPCTSGRPRASGAE